MSWVAIWCQVRPPKKSLWLLVVGRLQNRWGDTLFFFLGNLFVLPIGKYVIHVCTGTKFPRYKLWWLREANQENVHTPMWKSRFKHSTAEIQSSNFGCNWTIAKIWKLKMPMCGSEETKTQRIFFNGLSFTRQVTAVRTRVLLPLISEENALHVTDEQHVSTALNGPCTEQLLILSSVHESTC